MAKHTEKPTSCRSAIVKNERGNEREQGEGKMRKKKKKMRGRLKSVRADRAERAFQEVTLINDAH